MQPRYAHPTTPMAVPSLKLYDICMRRVSMILKGRFRDEAPNPFVVLPSCIVHDLIAFIFDLYSTGGFRAYYIEPLLLTGRVKHITLQNLRLEEELLPTLRSFTICRRLKSLNLINVCEFDLAIVSRLLEELLKALKNLEELHCSVSFSLAAIRKCKKLRIAKLHFTPESYLDDLLEEVDGQTQAHENLSVLTLCGRRAEEFLHFKEVAELLVNCPRLHSLGYLDVSKALRYLHGSDTSNIRKYGLESCCWREHKVLGWSEYEDDFLLSIRTAALACPMLKELVVKIPRRHYEGAISVLRTLRNLTYLEIEFDRGKKDFRPEIFSLLSEIGSNLQHLALHRVDNIEFDAILKFCPELVSLKIDCKHVVGDWTETSANPRQLQRLAFFSSEGYSGSNSLRLLLSKCCNLQELFLKNSEFLTDSFLSRLLKDNPIVLAQLKIACICDCCLTKDGLKNFLSYAKKLEKISLESTKISEEEAENLIREMNSEVTIIPDYDEGIFEEFFHRRRYVCA
ncbi:uncharacterized protein LOC129957663 [Argiope bruennichi]|uniref:Uncharacterized protein n=1 Tax=Argiope bruennichi TaxID=94029 RepID=A0A8T0FC19_ARGBR|nr:uncharacterized protein LOC129957663 [Argiope bruennichi]KAF8788451.1 hypothetical protein HNY73_006495 [Argiope bruennichi]